MALSGTVISLAAQLEAKAKTPSKDTITYKKVLSEIITWVNDNSTIIADPPRWYAGITNDQKRRNKEHRIKNARDCKYWKYWDARSLRIAVALETALKELELCHEDGQRGANINSRFIYVYKKFPTIFD